MQQASSYPRSQFDIQQIYNKLVSNLKRVPALHSLGPIADRKHGSPDATPPPFPTRKYPGSMRWDKHEDFDGEISNKVLRSSWQRRCIELRDLPAPDLTNAIHPIFARNKWVRPTRFNAQEYDLFRPVLTLASRLITEDNYLGW
jgi:hypothetical protein